MSFFLSLSASVTATVVIRVKDKNDNVPSFGSSSPILRLDVPDNVTVPWTLATLTVSLTGSKVSISDTFNRLYFVDLRLLSSSSSRYVPG